MLLHEAVQSARKNLGLSQKRLAELAGIQRKQLATLEKGGNVTLATLRKVLAHLPNLETFSLDTVTATVLRQVSPEEEHQALEAAIAHLNQAIRGFVTSVQAGQLPDESVAQAFQDAADSFGRGFGYSEDDLRRKHEQAERQLEEDLQHYRRGADAAFRSILDVARTRGERRRRRAKKDA
jgi:transcriptional regulator with XRE-family HTH domain